MAKRLRVKHKKQARDIQTAYKKGEWPTTVDKVARRRSRAAKLRKANRV